MTWLSYGIFSIMKNVLLHLSSHFKLEEEIERRKELGFRFQQTLQLQDEIYSKDEEERERHQVGFMALAREVTRLLKDFGEYRKQMASGGEEGQADYSDEFDENLVHK